MKSFRKLIAVLTFISMPVSAMKLEQDAWDIYLDAKLEKEVLFSDFEAAYQQHLSYGSKPILAMIDYSLASSAERFWIVDLINRKIVAKTHVSHGVNSGELYASFFSNKPGSKTSSVGTFLGAEVYKGKYGRSLRLDGVSATNNNARKRAIVIHGAKYSDPKVIASNGMLGTSWGCPSVPIKYTDIVINALKNGGTIYAYR